jgi:hypothetical protein
LNIQAKGAGELKTGACKGGLMITLEMNDEEGKLLINVLERYHSHLEVEVKRTDRREFREALKEREAKLMALIGRVKALVKE